MQSKDRSHLKRFFHLFPAGRENRGGPALAAAALLLVVLTAGCHVTPYHRTLPDWVDRVYVPMALNETAEPGLEELITNAFTTELLADGRLDVVRKNRSNAVLQVTIKNFEQLTADHNVDAVESVREVNLILGLELFEPSDSENPLLHAEEDVIVPFRYASSTRSVGSLLRVDAMDRLSETTARMLLHNLMTRMTEIVETAP